MNIDHANDDEEASQSEFVELDPTGRYGRYKEILGKGASKTVYRAYDEYQGIEVAWNQVKLQDFLNSPQDLERLHNEIHLLKTLKHDNIMKYYTSWVDNAKRNINFVTEMFSSGTLKQYGEKHRRTNIKAIKSWCRQILKGLHYLHTLNPPVIHRDLKCDNIFVNGNQGEVKIGDLGLAEVLHNSHFAHCVGTPEFMAPEVYAEDYNELVDIYSFGMCILEMVTFEYPYSECTHSAEIYKKVTSGEKPKALRKVKDPEIRKFIDKCIANVSQRLSARELLQDPFLEIDSEFDVQSIGSWREDHNRLSLPRKPHFESDNLACSYNMGTLIVKSNEVNIGTQDSEWERDSTNTEHCGIELFDHFNDDQEDHPTDVGITIKGRSREDGSIFLRLRILDDEERVRNIYFPFDVEHDTALSVATEMVGELDITDQDVTKIADIIDWEIISLVPDWKPGSGYIETPRHSTKSGCCDNCAPKYCSTGSFLNFLPSTSFSKELKILQCLGNGCAATHGRFEEVTFQINSPPKQSSKSSKQLSLLNQVTDGFNRMEIWDRKGSRDCNGLGMGESCSFQEIEKMDQIISTKSLIKDKDRRKRTSSLRKILMKSLSNLSVKSGSCFSHDLSQECENEIQPELRRIGTKYHMRMKDITEQQLRVVQNSPMRNQVIKGISPYTISTPFQGEIILKSRLKGRKSSQKILARRSRLGRESFKHKFC